MNDKCALPSLALPDHTYFAETALNTVAFDFPREPVYPLPLASAKRKKQETIMTRERPKRNCLQRTAYDGAERVWAHISRPLRNKLPAYEPVATLAALDRNSPGASGGRLLIRIYS